MARYIDAEELYKRVKDNVGAYYASQVDVKDECLEEIENMPTADVAPKSEEGAECPTCHGTGRIGTTNWLTKNISKKQLAEEKAKAIAEHEQYIKTEYAREIFEEIEFDIHQLDFDREETRAIAIEGVIAKLKKKYTEGK